MEIFLTFSRLPTEQSYLNFETFMQIIIYISLTINRVYNYPIKHWSYVEYNFFLSKMDWSGRAWKGQDKMILSLMLCKLWSLFFGLFINILV